MSAGLWATQYEARINRDSPDEAWVTRQTKPLPDEVVARQIFQNWKDNKSENVRNVQFIQIFSQVVE